MSVDAPIGIFDSGVGGLTVARAVIDQLPAEQIVYVEVVLPAFRRAVAATRTGRIGVIGTRATIASGAYTDAFAAARGVEVTGVACPRFVDFVERGMTSGRQVLGLAQGYLEPLQQESTRQTVQIAVVAHRGQRRATLVATQRGHDSVATGSAPPAAAGPGTAPLR